MDPLEPLPEQIQILDIAHALSLLCRANGHFKSFYSVAQHSVNCAAEAKKRKFSSAVQLACLLHDGSEAYLSDLTRPVKHRFADYLRIEESLQSLIYRVFGLNGLSAEEHLQVKQIDDAMLYWEFMHLMDEKISIEEPELISSPDFLLRSFESVEQRFLKLFDELTKISGLVVF